MGCVSWRVRSFKMFWDIFKRILKVGFLQRIWVGNLCGYYGSWREACTCSFKIDGIGIYSFWSGAKFGGYGSFLPTYQRSSSIWSHPKTPQRVQNYNKAISPNTLLMEVNGKFSFVFIVNWWKKHMDDPLSAWEVLSYLSMLLCRVALRLLKHPQMLTHLWSLELLPAMPLHCICQESHLGIFQSNKIRSYLLLQSWRCHPQNMELQIN